MSLDMLVKLYDLAPDPALDRRLAEGGIEIRRALPPELVLINRWIEPRFGAGWVSETTVAMARQPPACFLAVKGGELIGFACYDATARGFFGPTGVDETARGLGAGQGLLLACLTDMRNQGYGYGVIGAAGPQDFYRRCVGAIGIEGSSPGIYRGMLRDAEPTYKEH
ncbi:N-acetyltransferase [Aureimonas endophytica]|uniref:N-acetyltransferase n=1 Tax=Aureimonas endophytica TaxID=2027858 RepID=A0A917E2R1_9HYPH|nr:GNAT family N-acetyltransferase [Aureimonas endophytica]GGD99326.1 N-acetyltransferase [Aureimonas endophytica]